MKGGKLHYPLLVLAFACTGCHASTPSRAPHDSQVSPQQGQVPVLVRLPAALLGVWYPDDAQGASACERYRTLSRGQQESDDGTVVLVGSLVVTPNLIHAFSEYGEGDFHLVERVQPGGRDAWRITASVGIDAMPDDASTDARVLSRMSLPAGKLHWQSPADRASSSPYVRCDVRPPMMRER